MKKMIMVCLLLSVSIAAYLSFSFNDVKILDEYDFSEGDWKLVKGYYNDSVEFVISDLSELEKLKDEWVLNDTEKNFATTGGYQVHLLKNNAAVFSMDLIIDGKEDIDRCGILYHSKEETLAFKNLHWLQKGNWRREVVKSH